MKIKTIIKLTLGYLISSNMIFATNYFCINSRNEVRNCGEEVAVDVIIDKEDTKKIFCFSGMTVAEATADLKTRLTNISKNNYSSLFEVVGHTNIDENQVGILMNFVDGDYRESYQTIVHRCEGKVPLLSKIVSCKSENPIGLDFDYDVKIFMNELMMDDSGEVTISGLRGAIEVKDYSFTEDLWVAANQSLKSDPSYKPKKKSKYKGYKRFNIEWSADGYFINANILIPSYADIENKPIMLDFDPNDHNGTYAQLKCEFK